MVENYLLEDTKYTNKDINKISGTYTWLSKNCKYGALLTFVDDPLTQYSYSVCSGKVIQDGYTGQDPKHLE